MAVSDTDIDIAMLGGNDGGGGEGRDTSVTSSDGSVEVVETETEGEKNYDLSIKKELNNFKTTDPDMKEAIESAKMAHLYIVDNDGSKKMARMFSQFTPYSDKYTETRIGLYAILRQEEKILGAGHFILSYYYKNGEGVDLLYHGLAGEKNVANYIKVKHISSVTQSKMGEIVLYADFGDLDNKSCSISFSVNARNPLTYFDFTGMNKSVNYTADYVAKPMEENLGEFNFDIEYSDNDEYGNERYTFTNQQQLIDFKRLYLNGMIKNISITISSSDSNDVFYPIEKWEGKNSDGNIAYVEFYCNFTEGSILGISIDLNSIEDSSAYQTYFQRKLSQSEYDELQSKSLDTLYFITD